MASLANNLQKALRHHIPLIRFKYGLNPSGAKASSHSSSENKIELNPAKTIGASSSANQLKSAKKSVSLEFSQTPKKYRRRPLTQDEIDLVAIGGFT